MSHRMRSLNRLSIEQLEEFRRDYAGGMLVRELCAKYDLSESSANRLIERLRVGNIADLKKLNGESRELKKLRKKVAEQEKIIEAFRDVLHRKILRRKI